MIIKDGTKVFKVTSEVLKSNGIWGIRAFNYLEKDPKEVCKCLSRIFGAGNYTYMTIIPYEEILVLKGC